MRSVAPGRAAIRPQLPYRLSGLGGKVAAYTGKGASSVPSATDGQLAVAVDYLIALRGRRRGLEAAVIFEGQQPVVAMPGFYLQARSGGFALRMNASQARFQQVRELTDKTLVRGGGGQRHQREHGAGRLRAHRQLGAGLWGHVPLVVKVNAEEARVSVKVHAPDSEQHPCRSGVPLDDAEADSGRGVGLVDFLPPGWQVRPTPFGKQIVCLLPCCKGDRLA